MTAKEHNKLVGIFLMAHGGLQAIVMAGLCLVYVVLGGAMIATGSDRDGTRFAGAMIVVAILFVFAMAAVFVLPQIVGGYKLLKEGANARPWGIVGSIIACLSFPLGTAAGVYGLWFLFGEEGKRHYLESSGQRMFQNSPPTHGWR